MRNLIKTTVAISVLAALTLNSSGALAEGAVLRPVTSFSGGEKAAVPHIPHRDGGRRSGRGEGGLGFLGGFLGGLGSAFIEDSATHYGETCVYIGDCKISVIHDPDGPPAKPVVEIRKKAPKPIRHVTDRRTGWTYYLAEDRNMPGPNNQFIQIVDANGADVHIDGEIPMPGGGPIYPVR